MQQNNIEYFLRQGGVIKKSYYRRLNIYALLTCRFCVWMVSELLHSIAEQPDPVCGCPEDVEAKLECVMVGGALLEEPERKSEIIT